MNVKKRPSLRQISGSAVAELFARASFVITAEARNRNPKKTENGLAVAEPETKEISAQNAEAKDHSRNMFANADTRAVNLSGFALSAEKSSKAIKYESRSYCR